MGRYEPPHNNPFFLVFDMAKAIPTLSTRGYLTSMDDIVDMALSHSLVAHHSQTEIYLSKITSLPYLVSKYGHIPERLAEEMKIAYTQYFQRFFPGVIIETNFEYLNGNNGGPYNVNTTFLLVSDEGQRVNIASQLEIRDGKFKELARLNNEGAS